MLEPSRSATRTERRPRWRILSLCALLISSSTVSYSSNARAEDAPVEDAQKTADAQRHFRQAIALYNDGNFEAALAEFLAAYQTKPAPSILYNIGLTYKSLFLYNDSIRSLEQYVRDESKLLPERRAEVDQILREMRALLADVALAITPEGATVKLDGRTIGKAPIGQYLIAAGRHVLEVSADGYTMQTKEIMVTAGVQMALAVALAIIPKTGRIRVSVAPSGASLKLDGRVYPPPVDVELGLGGHTLEAWATGYVVHREEVLIAPGQIRDINVSLRRTGITHRAAFIVPVTIAAILLAGGIAAGAVCGSGNCTSDILSGTLQPFKSSVGR